MSVVRLLHLLMLKAHGFAPGAEQAHDRKLCTPDGTCCQGVAGRRAQARISARSQAA